MNFLCAIMGKKKKKKSMKNIHNRQELSVSLEKHARHESLMSKLGIYVSTLQIEIILNSIAQKTEEIGTFL